MKTIKQIVNRKTTHVAGTFVIHADAAFLNGAGLGSGEDKNVSTVKSFWMGKQIPYVSSQSWRRWLRNTLIEETGWKMSQIEAIDWNTQGNTSKIAGQLNPIEYQEDDIFGYMFASSSKKKEKNEKMKREHLPETQLVRSSPFKSSLLSGVPSLVRVARDEGFVHLKDDTPLPYTTEFYAGELAAIFGIELFRIGLFEKKGALSQELDPYLIEKHSDILEVEDHPVYDNGTVVYRKDLSEYQSNITKEVLNALAKLRGGSKLAQFGTDVSPKMLIIAGMKTGNLIFSDLLISNKGEPALNVTALKEIISDYSDKFTTPVFIGLRKNYLSNEDEIHELTEVSGIQVMHGTPISIVDGFINELN